MLAISSMADLDSCPTCASSNKRVARDDCYDAWHRGEEIGPTPRSRPEHHTPLIARELYDGPGNTTRVHGCSCGAEVMSTKAFAEHVSWPTSAVHAMLGLVGIAYDLIEYPAEMRREDVVRRVRHCLEIHR
jgi:hypothetical protein